MVDGCRTTLFLDREYSDELEGPQPLVFETADRAANSISTPARRNAPSSPAAVCARSNDVIRAIVLEAYHAYRAPSVLGIRYGLEGFIPSCRHGVMELTPASVEHIYQFGGTLLGSSRGPQAPEEIVDALERLNVSILFVIMAGTAA